MKRKASFIRGAVVLVVGILCLVALAVAGTPGSGRLVEFSLAANSGDPGSVSFNLAPRSAEPIALAGLGGSEVIEDPDWPFRTALGYEALKNNTPGADNYGLNNTAVGYQALTKNTTGYFNTANGHHALQNNLTGNNNTAIGNAGLLYNNYGSENTAVGGQTLEYNDGSQNTAVGFSALITGTHQGCTAIGADALFRHAGNKNTALGYRAGSSVFTDLDIVGNFNLFLGADVVGLIDDTNTIRIGLPYNASVNPPEGQNRTFIAGIVETPLTANAGPAVVGITSEGRLGTFPSELLPVGPQGSQGIQGPPGPAGEGLVSGSLLFLLPGIAPPAGYTFMGSSMIVLTVPGSRRLTTLTINVYRK